MNDRARTPSALLCPVAAVMSGNADPGRCGACGRLVEESEVTADRIVVLNRSVGAFSFGALVPSVTCRARGAS